MKIIRLAINGFGRIGRAAFKIALERPEVEVVAVNDLSDAPTLCHLLNYDTAYGRYNKSASYDQEHLIVEGRKVKVFSIGQPEELPWRESSIDVVIESTGRFTTAELSSKHLSAGAKRVIISAPSEGENRPPVTIIGLNHDSLTGREPVISNASCTTNSITPVISVLERNFGLRKAMMTTVHAYTADQNLQDGPHRDLRRARSAAENIVPTSTGAAEATTEVIKELKGKFDGLAIRVPVPLGSISDITALVARKTSLEAVNRAFIQASKDPGFEGILAVTSQPLVSSDIIGDSHSAIVDLSLTRVVDQDLVKVVSWYDNEWGYANRLIDQVVVLGKKLNDEN